MTKSEKKSLVYGALGIGVFFGAYFLLTKFKPIPTISPTEVVWEG